MPGLTDLLRNPRRLRQFAETPGNYPAALEYATQDQAQGRVGRRPASRASSSTKEPGKLDTGEYIDQVELPDGSVVRPATESGKLVKAPGKSNLYLDPATGEPYHADPSQATGLRSAWNTARQVKRDGKVYATISGVGEREIGADPKAAEDAAKAEAKRAAENRRLELAREKRPYNIDRVTGEPVPLQTDEQWAAIKQAKAAKLDESARVKRLKDQADVIDLEADRVTLNAPKPAKEDEEAFNAAEAALMPHAAGQDLEQVAKKYAGSPATDETSQQAKSAAENYLAYKDKVKPARDAEKKVKELKLRAIDIKEQIINPQKWKEGKTASIAGLPDDDLVAEAKAQADIITEQEGQAVGTLDQITQGRNKIVKDLNDFTAARQRQASVGLSVEEQQAADHTQAQMEQSLAEYDDWHSEAKAEADASLKAAADRRDVLKVASTEIEARTAKQKESAAASKAKMEVMVKAKPLYKDWAGGASGLYVEDWRTEEETPRFKQEAAKAGLSMPEAKEALQTYRQLDWSNGRRDPKTANEIHEDARLLPNGEITVNPMHLLDPEAYNAAADATETTPEAKARAKAMRAELAVPVAEEAYKNLRKNSDFAAWLDANTTGTPLQRMEKFNAEMKSGGALNASLMKFLGSAASLPSGWLGTIAGLTGSDKALEYARYWQDRSQAYGTAAGEAGKGTNMAGRFMASVAGGLPSVMESMAVGGVAGRLIGSGVAALGVAAVDAAAQSGGGTFVDAVDAYIAQGLSPEEAKAKAVAPALASGLATGVLTAIGGGGVESLLRRDGQELAKAAIKRGLKTMVAREVIEGVGEEALEEFSDQLLQGIIAQASYDPTKSLDQIMSEAIEAGLVGGVLGGGASGIRAYAEGKDANQTGAVPPTPGSPAPMPVQPRPAGPAPTPTPQVPQTPQDVADQVAKFNPTGATPLPQSVAATAKRTGRTPEAVARQAASGVVKLAQGQSIESLDIEEQEALGFVNKGGKITPDTKVTPLVYLYKDKPVLRNAAAEWLTDEAQEGLAAMVNLTEAERKAQIDAEEAAAKTKPASAPAKKARPADIEDWDWTEKGKVRRRATEEWFEEGMANADVNAAFERAHAVGADALASHGMAKFGTLSGAYDALMGLLTKGVDPKRGRGTLDVAPLTVAKGSAASQGGQTAGGTSYRDGPFILLSRKQSSIANSADIHAILVNDANAGQLEAIRREVHKLRPDIIVDLYSKADIVTQQLNQPANKKAGQAAPAKAESTPQAGPEVKTSDSLSENESSNLSPASTQTPANEPATTTNGSAGMVEASPTEMDQSAQAGTGNTEPAQAPAQEAPAPAPTGRPAPKYPIGKGATVFSDVYRSEGDVTLSGDPIWNATDKAWEYPAVTNGGRSFRVAERFVTKVTSTPTPTSQPTPSPAQATPAKPEAPATPAEPALTPTQADQMARAQTDHENRKATIQKMETDPEIRAKKLYAEGMRFAAIKRQITGKLTGKEQEAKAKREASNFEGKAVSVDGKNATVVGTAFGKVKVKFEDGTTSSVAADKINAPVKTAAKEASQPAPASQEAKPAATFKAGDFVRANGKGPVFKVESIGEDGWVYLANGQGSYSAEDAAKILVQSTEDAAKKEAVKGGWPWADKGEAQPPPAPSTPQRRMETALNEYEFSVRQTLVGTPTKATKDLAARKLDLAKRLRARLKAMTGAVEYDVYAKELREKSGELEVKPVGEKDSILFVNPEKLIDRLAGKHKTTEAAREALDAFILHEFIHKAAIARMDSAKIIGLYNLLTPAAKAASKALYLSDSGLTDFWHKSAAANEFAAAHEWFAQLIEARLRGKISNQAEIEASKDPAFRDKLMALLKDFVAQLRDIAKLVTDKTQAARIEAEADAVQAIVADMAAKAGLELGQQAKPPSQTAVAPEVAPEAASPQRDAVDEELAKAFNGLSAPPRRSATPEDAEYIAAAALKDPRTGKIFKGATHGYANPRDRSQLNLGLADDSQEYIGYVTNTGRWVSQEEAENRWGVYGSESSAAYWANPLIHDAAVGRGYKGDRFIDPITETEYQQELKRRQDSEAAHSKNSILRTPPASTQPVEQVALPKERREAMLKAAGNIVDLGLTEPIDLAARLDKLAPNGSLRKYARSFWRLMTGFNADLQESPDWQAVFDSIDAPSEQVKPSQALVQTVPQKLPPPTAKDLFDREKYPGRQYAAPPNTVTFQLRGLNTYPIAFPLQAVPASSLEEASKIIKDRFIDLIEEFDGSMRESSFAYIGPDGVATHLGEFMYDRPMQWRPYSLSEDPFNKITAESNVTPPQAAAIAKEEAMPEPAKQAAPFDPVAAKGQKKYLLTEVAAAVKAAPRRSEMPEDVRDALNEIDEITAKFANQERRPLTADESAELSSQVKKLSAKVREAVGTITIEVPGDGTFTILNEKGALALFQKRADKFPTTQSKDDMPAKPTAQSPTAVPAIKKPKTTADVVAAIYPMVSTDTTRDNLTTVKGDGTNLWATNGRILVRVEQENGGGKGADNVSYDEKGNAQPWPVEKGNYNGEAIIPEDRKVPVHTIDTGRWFSIMSQARAVIKVLPSDKSESTYTKAVSIYRNPDGSLGVFVSDVERGDYVHNIQPNAKFLASYDPEYVQTILRVARNLGNEQIELRIADDISPATLHTSNATFVIMPMRMNGAAAYSPKATAARPTPPVTTQPTPAPTPAPSTAPAKAAPASAPTSPAKEGIDDFGEKLGGARKDKVATVNQTLTDDEIAGKTLSEIWPKSEIASIEDDELAAYATTLRSVIPSKPQQGYKLNAWVGKVKMVKQLMRFAEDKGVPEMLAMMRGPEYNLGVLADRVAFLQGLPREHWDRVGEVRNYPNAYRFGEGADSSKKIPAPYADANVDGYRVRADNLDDLMEAVKAKLAKGKPVAKIEFEVRGRTGAWGINKKGDPHYRKLKTFADSKEALAYRDSNYDDLVKAWEDVKERDNVKETDLRTDTNRPRSAEDWRKGKDATSQMFNDAFGFRGVEFGNWVSQGKNAAERQGMMNDAYDALHDLASILNIPTKALSLNGQIGLGFGSRGQGWASAHYEPGSLVINLTKTRGAGTLAHELFHAFDHYFGRARGVSIKDRAGVYITNEPATRYVNQKTGQSLSVKRWNEIKKGFSSSINEADWKLQEGVRPEVEDAFEAVVKALDASPMAQRARMNDKGQRDYWGSTIERAARAFENYVIHKMQQKGYQNDYLANVVRIEDFVRNPNRYPYLLDNEIEPVAKAFDDLFSTIKSRETDKGVELYAPPSQASVGQAVNEAFVKKVQDSVKAGRTVGTSNPTTASKTGEGTDSGHNVELDRLRKNNPLAYRQNALILTRYPVVAKKYRALHAAMAKADAPVIAAKEEVKKAKAALAAAQKGIKDRVALLRGMKTAQVRASLVNEFIAANLTARAVKAKDVAHANLAKANAKAAKAADYQSKAISEILDGNAIPEDMAAQIYEDYITAVESNLLALIELFPKRLRDVARLWYDGANIIAQKFGEQYNATIEQASAVLAVFSPQKDWFMNVSLAQRMMNIWKNDQETAWSPEMTKQFIMRSGEPQPVESIKKGDTEPTISTRESLITDANPEGIVYQHGAIKKVDDDGNTYWENWDNKKAAENLKAAQLMLKDLEGKTLSQIKDRKLKARFIRILSEVRDSSAYPIVTPDGRTGAMQVNNDKVTLSKVAWGGYNTIEKAISIMERSVTIKGRVITDEHEVISIALGDQHKVRSFYNNIVDPANKSGHVTMDTHAIAAIHWMPHSGSSLEVTQNFGGGGVKNDGIAGIKGTYAANAEAYRRAAVVFDLLPREVQSITWEAVRLLFPKEFKTKGNIDKVRAIWNRYFHGDIDIETARAEIFALATTSKDFPQGKDIAGSIKDGKGLGDTAWAAAMGVGFDHPGGPEGTDDSGTVPQRGGPRGPNPRGGSGQSGGNGGGRNPAAVVRPTSILRRGGVGKPSLSLPPGQASPEAAAWKTVDGRTWLTEAEAKSTGLMYYNIEPDEAGLNDQVTEEERRMLQRGKVLDIEAESVPPSQAILRAPLNDSEADTLNRFDADAEESPAKVASSTSVHALRSHPDFNSAKFHGGVRQALNLVENFLKPAAIKEVRQAVGGDTDKLVFVPVLSREGDSMNMIPLALANELNRKIGGKVWTKLVKVSSAHNTDASNIDRAHTVHNWSGELPPEGSTIVLVDDTFTTGQTLQSLGDMFQKVAAVTTLAAGRYGKNFRPTKDQVAAAMKKANLSHSEYLKYRPTGAAIQSYLLNGKPGRNGWDERFTGEGSGGGSTTDGGDAKIPSLLSFFSGGGLLEVGLRGLVRGFGAVEFDANIAEVYAQNHGEHIDAADIRTINFNKFKGAEYFHASPVCKQFSGVNTHASKGENDADVTTAEATAKALKIIRPAVFTLENVKAYEGSSSLKIITDTLDDLGYTWDQGVYDAADYGAPTHRKRFLIRAVAKGGLPPAPKPTHGPKAGKPYKSWWSAVEDLVDELPSSPVPLKAKDGEGDSYIVKRMALMGVDLLSTKEPVFLAGGSASANNLPFSYSNEPAPVIKATNAEVNRILLPDGRQLRATPRVLARVTGLPDSYKLPESQELAVKVIGNGIPPALTRAVFGPLTALASRENPRLSLGGDDPVASAKAEAIKFLADKNPAFLRELESDTDAFPHGAYMLEVPLDQLRPGNAAFDEKTIASIPDMSAPIMVDASALFSTDKKSAGLVVSDGNHRLEKAKRRGDATIRAIVTPWDDAGMELVRSLAESERVDSTSQAILRAPPNAGVPTQITRDMRQQLLDRGYTKKQIHKMKPAEAHAILNPPVEPASPEPEEAGQTDADMEAFIAEQQAIAEEEAAAREALRNDPDAIDAVQASGKMSGRNLSKQFEYPEARAVYQALTSARDQLGGPETVQLDKLREWAKKTFDSDPEKYVQWAADMAEESKLLDVDEQAVLGQAFQFLTREARLTGDKNIRTLLNKVGNYYLDTGTRLAQAMSARRDPLETPQERWTKAIDIVFGPSEAVRRNLRILPTDAGKARRIASLEAELAEARGSRRADVEAALKTARAQETKEELLEKDDAESEKIKQAVLKNIGVTEDDLMLAGTDRVALHSAILDLPAVKEGLDAYKGKDNDGYNIMRLAFRGFSDEHIANALNLNQDDVGQFINDATNAIIRPAVAEQVKAGTDFGGLIKAGFAKLKKAVGLSNPPKAISAQSALIKGTRQTVGQVTAEVNRVMAYALQSAKARNSGKLMSKVVMTPGGQRVRVFVPFDPDDMANYYAFAREFTAAKSSAFDKVYEYWINWPLLSGPQTQVANITGNAAQVAWHYTGQRLAEATLNLAYQDPNSAQFREFKHVLKGFWQGIGPAFDMARQTFLTEGDTIRHKYLGEPMEIDVVNGDLDKVGNIRASVGGKLGRINRLPGRVLRFTDAFFKTAIMYAEASAVAYRRAHVAAKAQGLTGKARSTFIDTEIANTINDTSSAVWGEVMKTAEELLFQDENMATEIVDTVLGGYKGIRDLEQKLAEAEAKGDYEQSAKLQKRIRSRKIVGSLMRWIFPFQRTPTNIVRVGIKKAGGSAISLLYGLTMAGWRSMGKNGVPMIKSYPKAMQIKDASETLLAGLGWLALASMLEGDDDDDKKKVLLVGTRSHSLKDRGATDQFLRKYGGENSIVWQDGNGKVLGTLPFGRYEPAATLLTTWIDAYRNYQEVKRLKSQGENALYTTYMMSSLVSSLEDKSFLQGFANAMQFVRDVEEKRESPDENAGSKMLMNNIIPNLIKQPLRNMDDVLRERTTAGSGYAALPNPAVAPKLPIFAAQPKISTTGERLTKAFTPPARLLFQANTKVTPQADALLYRANRLNPTKRWSPQPLNRDDYTADPPGKAKPLPITDPAKRRQFAELAGRLYAAKAAQVAAKAMPSEKSKPTPSIITAFKKAREDAMAAARAQAHAIGLHKPTSTP